MQMMCLKHTICIIRGANQDSRSPVPDGAWQGISGYSGVDLGSEHLQGRVEQKNYQCHGTGGTCQFGALVYYTFMKEKD